MAILNGILQRRYHPACKEAEDARAPELTNVTMDEMNQPSIADPKTEAKYRAFRSSVFHTDLGGEYEKDDSYLAQQLILDAYHTIDLEIYNRRTNEEMRLKRLRQIIQVSAKREAQAMDLAIANLELKFFRDYVGIIDKNLPPEFSHIRKLRDVTDLHFTVNPSYSSKYVGDAKNYWQQDILGGKYICPITKETIGGKTK